MNTNTNATDALNESYKQEVLVSYYRREFLSYRAKLLNFAFVSGLIEGLKENEVIVSRTDLSNFIFELATCKEILSKEKVFDNFQKLLTKEGLL